MIQIYSQGILAEWVHGYARKREDGYERERTEEEIRN